MSSNVANDTSRSILIRNAPANQLQEREREREDIIPPVIDTDGVKEIIRPSSVNVCDI